MNTKQLIALWYTGIVIASLLLFGNGGIPFLDSVWEVYIIDAVIIGIISVYTFKGSNQPEWRLFLHWVLPAVIVPLIFIGVVIAHDYTRVGVEALPTSELEKVVFDGNPSHSDDGNVLARIYNGSSFTIEKVTLRITAHNFESFEEWEARKNGTQLNKQHSRSIRWSREYLANEHIPSLSTGLATLEIYDKEVGVLKYEITGAIGYRSK